MDEQAEHNGRPPRVPIGDKEWESLEFHTASAMLQLFKRRQPALFGAYLAETVTGAKPKAARGE